MAKPCKKSCDKTLTRESKEHSEDGILIMMRESEGEKDDSLLTPPEQTVIVSSYHYGWF